MEVMIVGTGNVAHALGNALSNIQHIKLSVMGRSPSNVIKFTSTIGATTYSFSDIIPANLDAIVLCVSDDQISTVSQQLTAPNDQCIIMHTSGSQPITSLGQHFDQRAIFYPLQTFNKDKTYDFTHIPICLNGNTKEALTKVMDLAKLITSKIYVLTDEERRKAHLAAVMTNNFFNYIGDEIFNFLSQNDIPYQLIQPLLQETVDKLCQSPPDTHQTGPARRGDFNTINSHLEMLKDSPLKQIYQTLSDNIFKKYKK